MEKIKITGPFDEKREAIKTSWGVIIVKQHSFEFIIKGVGIIEIFGWLTAEERDGRIIISGTQFDSPEVIAECELKD
jgi:hypothetical protein